MYKKNSKKAKKQNAEQKSMISLIIVDPQNDFYNKESESYVSNAENTLNMINDYVKKNKHLFNQVIITRDWHLKKDQSFIKNGGKLPIHCIQKTEGANLHKDLYETIMNLKIPTKIVDKGTVYNHDEAGAFEHCGTFHHLFPNDDPVVSNCFFANSESSSGSRIVNDNIIICGINAYDSLTKTISNLLKHWKFNIKLYLNGIATNNEDDLLNFINENKLKTI